MFLSKVLVSWRWAKDPYQLHRALWQLFPDRPQDQRDFLFRVGSGEARQGLNVLLQSAHPPQQAKVATVLATKSFSPVLPHGRYCFRLRANPVKSIKDEQARLNARGEIKTCRVPLLGDEECMKWLVRKLAPAAQLESARIVKKPVMLFHKKEMAGKIQTVCFDGVLTISDAEAFASLIHSGIGPAKSMGCGLLSLGRA